MASSSSSSQFEMGKLTVSQKTYDAFINHRGPDTKETVAFALYDTLEEKGFRTFLDDQELQLGDPLEPAIKNAISSSSVQIAIFSPRYAESPWCLDELVDMLKTNDLFKTNPLFKTNGPFIPVFCDVKSFDVRYPDKGVYKDAFAKHEEKGRFSKERLDDWKSALHSSSLICGYEFSTSKDNVEMLCSKINFAVQQKVGNKFQGFEDAELAQSSASVKKSSLLPRDSHPVGIVSKFKDMEGFLNNPEIQVIAVVGMGGLGKTFLLQHVYNELKSRYRHSIWLSISKSYSVKSLQRDVASHVGLKSEIVDADVSEERAAVLIHDCLQGKRCLIVLDDLWTLSTEDNLLDKLGLPGHKDFKVVVSSRNRDVGTNLKAHIYDMKTLSDEDSWELFWFYAFTDCKENRAPSRLEELGHEIVKQCGNLPLAIKTTAASLGKTKDVNAWELKLHQLEKAVILSGQNDPVMTILRFSYDSLAPRLKLCFAYLSFFPEDERIDCEYLVYLWIAEGLIPAGEEQWIVAWNWLDQLAQLCLLQICEDLEHNSHEYGILKKYCAIHDLLHDLAINISRENKCVFSLEDAPPHADGSTGWYRILLAKKDIDDNALSQRLTRPAYVRTLSLSQNIKMESITENLFTAIRGLRVLDLSRTPISTLPESVGKMILLRVLNLRRTWIDKVPECVRYLKNLLFLAISICCSELPEWITELKWLQHLECCGVGWLPKGTSKLISLRTLQTGCVYAESIQEDLACMTQLQEIGLKVHRERDVKRIEGGLLVHPVKMRRLGIENAIDWPNPMKLLIQLVDKIRAMKHLESLALCKFPVPSWMCDLASLRELELTSCDCIDYPALDGMPNLVKLVLDGNTGCIKLPKAFGKSPAFPRLRFLVLANLLNLEEFPELEEGAMACLEDLSLLDKLPALKEFRALECLKSLKKFSYSPWMAKKLLKTLKEGEKYHNKIKAINPHLTIMEI